MTRLTFVMEQHLGHLTYYQNLRRFVELQTQLQTSWIPITYSQSNSLWARLPELPHNLRGTFEGRSQVREALAATTSDVVFFNTQVPAVLGGSLTRRQPYVVATDITPIQYDQMCKHYNHAPDRHGPLKVYKHLRNLAMLRHAAHLLPWSSWTRNSLIRDYGVDPNQITVIAPGVDLNQWMPKQRQAEGPLRILFVGGDLYRKGGDLLLRAFRTLPCGTAELHLVTRTPIEPEEHVQVYHDLKPNDPALVALYQRADVFVLPSDAEAFGIAAAEACSAGLAVIATAVGGLTDIVIDGETGFLIPVGDQHVLSERLQMLLERQDLREQMGHAARLRAEALFDARRNADRVIACMLEAITNYTPVHQTA